MSLIRTAGATQFLIQRRQLLGAFRTSKAFAREKQIRVSHGLQAEALFRKWLSDFLPKAYSVSSGFLISQGIPESSASLSGLKHFDIIIYDHLTSPVLWVEETSDQSEYGKLKAIPVEHVRAVIEVKAMLNSRSSKEALKKLEELRPLLGNDNPGERYKQYLPSDVTIAVVFFEVAKAAGYKSTVLDELRPRTPLRGHIGGLVLVSCL